MSKKRLILIIANNEDDIKTLRILFSKTILWTIYFIRTGKEGVREAQESKPDIVVADIQLPDIDCFEACRRIKAVDNGKIKVILITDLIDTQDAIEARRAGADAYIMKTKDYDRLFEKINEYV
ncbi:MAG: response regulator [Candidatus Omnitrophota bacterium]